MQPRLLDVPAAMLKRTGFVDHALHSCFLDACCPFACLCAQLAVCDSPAGLLALTVCYDLRFPEMWQRLAFDLVRAPCLGS